MLADLFILIWLSTQIQFQIGITYFLNPNILNTQYKPTL